MSFAAGLAASIGAGLAIGMSSGTKQARNKLGQYLESQDITLRDQQGKQVGIDDVLDQALSYGEQGARKIAIVLLTLGLIFAASVGAAVYFLLARG